MREISRVLLAYDGSTCSDAALEDLKRAGLPARLEAVVMSVAALVFLPPDDQLTDDEVVSPGAAAMVSALQEEARATVSRARAIAEKGADRVKTNFPGWVVSCKAEGDSPAWAVIKTAEHLHSDLIIVGAHRHSSLGGRLIMGSVSQRVVYEANCPVRLARCSNQQREGPVRIILGFEGSTEAVAAADAVASRVWPAGSELRIVSAGETITLKEQQEKLRAAGLVISEVTRRRDLAHALIDEGEHWGADSIFVGSRNVHGLQHLLHGSVALAVAARAQCSVEVVRPVERAA